MANLWPYFPMPEIGEELRWQTDILATRTLESRTALRPARRAYLMSYAVDDAKATAMEALYSDGAYGDWLLPIWTEASEASVAAADTVIFCDTDASYTDQALIYKGCGNYVLVDIVAMDAVSITLSAPIGVAFGRVLVCPVTTAYVEVGLALSRPGIRGVNAGSMVFVERVNPAPEATQFEQYLGLDLAAGCLAVAPMASAIQPLFVRISNGAGPVVLEPSREFLNRRFAMTWAFPTAPKRRGFQKWLNYLRGRDRAFWLTGWRSELVLAASIAPADTFVQIKPVLPNIADYIGQNIMIDDGVKSAREITAALVVGLEHRLSIAPLGRAVTTARVSFLRKVRLDSDTVNIAHHRGFSARCELNVVGVPD